MNLFKRLILCACVMAALSCGEQNKMLELATTGNGLVEKHIYVFATNPSGAPYDVFLLIADEQSQLYESLVGKSIPNAFGNFHVSDEGIAFMCFTVPVYVNFPPYSIPWINTTTPFTPTGVFFVSNENGIYVVDTIAPASLYRYEIIWQSIGSFSNANTIMATDLSEGSDFIYTIEVTTYSIQSYSFSTGFQSQYTPTYTPAIAPGLIYLHRGDKFMYVGTTNRFYFCGNPTNNSSEQYVRLGSDMTALSPAQNATSYCVPSDESMIFAATAESVPPNTMHLYVRNKGSWLELLSFPGNAGDSIKLFDLEEGKLVLWVDSASTYGGVYVFDYKKMKLNRVLINPSYTIQSVVVK